MFRILGLFILTLLPAEACKWDRDTLKEEAKGNLDTVKAITGWFDRYPASYYEMRLERVAKELESDPGRLDLYDDAGVACDRLGHFDEAIAWMERKITRIQTLPVSDTEEHRYRYLANLGSFHMDRWISRAPEVRNADLADLREAERFVAAAIELNPDAHFGRERYQLQMIHWLLADKPARQSEQSTFVPDFLKASGGPLSMSGTDAKDAVAGLTGLVLMGESWMSPDVFSSLGIALDESKLSSVAQLAHGRSVELEGLGEKPLHPLAGVRERMKSEPSPYLEENRRESVNKYFKEARNAAEARRMDWLAYQSERFDRGMHPDTHPDFWKDWKEPVFPQFPKPPMTIVEKAKLFFAVVAGLILAAIGFFIRGMWKRANDRKPAYASQ